MSETPQPPAASWFETWVVPFFDTALLWPVLFAVLGHFVALWVPALLMVYRYTAVPSILFLGLSVVGTGVLIRFESRLRGRPGGMSLAVMITWLVTFYGAYVCEVSGYL